MKMKGARDYQKTHLSNGHYNAYNTKSLIVNYNMVVISSIDITLESLTLNAGTHFMLKRAFKENGKVFIEIETKDFDACIGFKKDKNNRIKNRKELRTFLGSFIYQVIVVDD